MILKRKRYNYLDMLSLAYKSAPVCTVIDIIQSIIRALFPAVTIFATANFVNTAIRVYNGEMNVGALFVPTLWLALLVAYERLAENLENFLRTWRDINVVNRLTPGLAILLPKFPKCFMDSCGLSGESLWL